MTFGDARAADAVSPPHPTIQTVPSLVEYQFNGVAWRCGKFDSLVTELGEPVLTLEGMVILHTTVSGLDRSWKILRRLFGLMPVMPPSDYPMDDMRSWQRDELSGDLGIKRAQLDQELNGIRGLWKSIAPKVAVPPANEPEKPFSGELALEADKELMATHGLVVAFHAGERELFLARVRDFEPVLREKTTAGLARGLLMSELHIMRTDRWLAENSKTYSGGKEYRANLDQRTAQAKEYREQLQQLSKQAPWFSSVGGKHTFAGTLSDITAAMQAYYGNGDQELADGIFTLTEIEVECRRSVQAPEPKYRADLVVYYGMAKAFLFDPKWQDRLERKPNGELAPSVRTFFKKIRAAWKAEYISQEDKEGVVLPDLEGDGEYAELAPVEKI